MEKHSQDSFGNTNNDQRLGGDIRKDGNSEFIAIEPSDLTDIPLMSQGGDNQWLPRDLLKQAFKAGGVSEEMEQKRQGYVRDEYIRALINGQQLVINRAYLYNNPAIFRDYLTEGTPNYQGFLKLLEKGIIVPYLYNEESPQQMPAFGQIDGFQAWLHVCQQVKMSCLRLSWGDENHSLVHKEIALGFHNAVEQIRSRSTEEKLFEKLLRDLGLSSSDGHAFRQRLIDLKDVCSRYMDKHNKPITRDHLYQQFVTSGENTADRHYHAGKLFACEIKELLDLTYNSMLPDALLGYLLTPAESLSRTTLQTSHNLSRTGDKINGQDIMAFFRRDAFANIQEGLYIKSMRLLSLQDVLTVRNTGVWLKYIDSFKNLIRDPLKDFTDKATQIQQDYEALAVEMTQLKQKHSVQLDKWQPTVEILIEAGPVALSIIWSHGDMFYQFIGGAASLASNRIASVTARLIIGGIEKIRNQADLTASIYFLKRQMEHPKEQWEEIQKQFDDLRRRGLAKESLSYDNMEMSATVNGVETG